MGRVQLGVLQTVGREPVDLALAQVVGADVVVIVVLMTVRTGQFQLTIAGVIHLFALLPRGLGRTVDGDVHGHAARLNRDQSGQVDHVLIVPAIGVSAHAFRPAIVDVHFHRVHLASVLIPFGQFCAQTLQAFWAFVARCTGFICTALDGVPSIHALIDKDHAGVVEVIHLQRLGFRGAECPTRADFIDILHMRRSTGLRDDLGFPVDHEAGHIVRLCTTGCQCQCQCGRCHHLERR